VGLPRKGAASRAGRAGVAPDGGGEQDPRVPVAPGSTAPRSEARELAREPEAPELAALGEPVDLGGLAADAPALLFFYKGDCGASDAAAHVLPRLARLPGLGVAAVSQDGAQETDAFSRTHGLAAGGVRILVDPEPWQASDAYGILSTPTFVLLAPGGRVDAVLEGWSRDDANALAARAASLAGAPAGAVSTPADGPAFRPG
jgi:thiol-disulfide isomerase/thioredoxin